MVPLIYTQDKVWLLLLEFEIKFHLEQAIRMRTVGYSGRLGGGTAWGDVHLPPWTEFLIRACENITFPDGNNFVTYYGNSQGT